MDINIDFMYILILCFLRVQAKVAQIEDVLAANLLVQDTNKLIEIVIGDKIIDKNNKSHETRTESGNCHSSQDLDNNIDTEENEPCVVTNKEDNGTALLLTPYLEQGRFEEARNACRVDHKLFFGIDSYSGFLTVNSTSRSHLYFWYFPVLNKPVLDSPWIIWLQGGPGASSLSGLFDEIGPFKVFNNDSLRFNPYTWLRNHSLVFIDNPVGAGYSFTESKDGFVTDMATYSKHLHIVVKQLIQLFPELKIAPLFVAGESYAGKYVPALAMEIHKHKHEPDASFNLKGLIIGNAYVEPKMISQVILPFYYFGLLEKEQIDIVRPLIEAFQSDIAANRSVEAKTKWSTLILVLLNLSHQKHAYNFLQDELMAGGYTPFLDRADVKRALHVGDIRFSFVNVTVNTALAPDFLSNAKPLFETLLDHYKVLAYCGQLDQMLPCALSADMYRTWRWKASKEFLKAIRHPYIFNNRVAGYHKSGGGLTWMVVRGAGHMVPQNKPAPAQEMVTFWTHSRPLPRPADVLSQDLLAEIVRNSTLVYL